MPVDKTKLVRNLQIRRGLEGPQFVLTWDAPEDLTNISQIVIRRKQYGFPRFITEGGEVFAGPPAAGFLTDLDLAACRCYYYTAFTVMVGGEVMYNSSVQVSELALETGFFARKLFELLPVAFVNGDKRLAEGSPGKIALEKTFDSVGKEFFNLIEDGTLKKGELQRFLRVMAVELDIAKGLIDCLPSQFDVDETCCKNLQAMGALLGIDVNTEFPCEKQRNEIKQWVPILQVKGTGQAIAAKARSISELTTRIQEWCKNILITNRLDRTTLVHHTEWPVNFDMPGDTVDYTPGGGKGFTSFTVYFLLGDGEENCDVCLDAPVVKKLAREVPKLYPVCRQGNLVFIDCRFVDEYDVTEIEEIATDEIEDLYVEDYTKHCWLITNRLTDTVSPPVPPSLIGPSLASGFGLEHHYTNSLEARTAGPSVTCFMDDFFDLVECVCRINRGRINCSRIGECADTELVCTPRVSEARVDCSAVE